MVELPTRASLDVTEFFDYEDSRVTEFLESVVQKNKDPKTQIKDLYYAVRDGFRYNPYLVSDGRSSLKASYCLEKKEGYCLTKAVLLGACYRKLGFPTRLGLADVKNHLASPELIEWLGTDLFVMHGFTDVFLNGKWIKATPAFNKELCAKFGVKPLEFDGENDSIFQEFTDTGKKYMEFVTQHGSFDDVPVDFLSKAWAKHYPRFPQFK